MKHRTPPGFQAGPKLRAKAIERTRQHIERERRGKTELSMILHGIQKQTCGGYLAEELQRLAKLEGRA